MDVIFTIVSRNYAALARSLMMSVAEHEPAARRVVIATDGPLEADAEILDAADVCPVFADMCVYYDALELNTAVKPYAFGHFLGEGAASVTYLDPDIFLFRPLEKVRAGLAEAELVLTPHLTRPLLGEASPNDRAILQSGVYNLGFCAMGHTDKTRALAAWWADRCRFDCRVAPTEGLFTDQRWMDLAPGFVDAVSLIRDPGYNLAYWNLEGRDLARTAEGWQVDGRPLAFFHFSGFDPSRARTLSKHQDRLTVASGSPLEALLADYGKVLTRNGHAESRAVRYAHNHFPNGRAVTGLMRRRALRAARDGERFDGLTAESSAWFDDPEPARPGITRLMDQAWREAPEAGFDLADAGGREGFRRWFLDNAARLGADDRAVAAARALADGGVAVDPATRFADDPDGLLAWNLGPESVAGRFDPRQLPTETLARLAGDPALLARAAAFADPAPPATALGRRLAVGFRIAERGRWPDVLTRPLRAPHLAPAKTLPAPFVAMFEDIWTSRADLQRLYPLASLLGRLRFLRWLLAGGLAEYGVEVSALPASVRGHPLVRLAQASLRGRTR